MGHSSRKESQIRIIFPAFQYTLITLHLPLFIIRWPLISIDASGDLFSPFVVSLCSSITYTYNTRSKVPAYTLEKFERISKYTVNE